MPFGLSGRPLNIDKHQKRPIVVQPAKRFIRHTLFVSRDNVKETVQNNLKLVLLVELSHVKALSE